MADESNSNSEHEKIQAKVADYAEGLLAEAEIPEVEKHLEGCDECRESVAEIREAVSALSSLSRLKAPDKMQENVAETIHRRSAGRFFGRRTFGDRVPLEMLAIVALVLGLILYFLLRGSETGALKPFAPEPELQPIPELGDAPP